MSYKSFDSAIKQTQLLCDEINGKKTNNNNNNNDTFEYNKKEISNTIKQIRILIGDRNKFVGKKDSEIDVIRLNHNIRGMLEQVNDRTMNLKRSVVNEESKWNKQIVKQIDNQTKKLELKIQGESIRNKHEIIRLIFCHIQECEFMLDGRTTIQMNHVNYINQNNLLSGGDNNNKPLIDQQHIVNLPDIDKMSSFDVNNGFNKQDKLDVVIGEKLDEVLGGMQQIKSHAKTISDEIVVGLEIIDDLAMDVESQNEALIKTNSHLKNIISKIRSPHKLCFDIFLLLLLGLIGLIIKVVFDKIK